MKKTVAVVLAFLLPVLCLASCRSAGADVPITVNSTPIEEALFCYYLDEAFGDPAYPDKNARVDYATQQCIRYVAVNTAFLSRGLSLTAAQRAAVSEETNALWRIFGAHYEKVGVTKEALFKLRTSMAYTEGLRTALFDLGGTMPVAESALQAYFATNFYAVRYIQGYLYTADGYGNPVNYTEAQLNEILRRFSDAAAQVNAGVSMEAAYAALSAYGDQDLTQHLTTQIVENGDPEFTREFYTAVAGIGDGKAAVCVSGRYVYLIQRYATTRELSWFRDHRAACLKAVSEPSLQNEINALCSVYRSERRRTAVNRCYQTVYKGRK